MNYFFVFSFSFMSDEHLENFLTPLNTCISSLLFGYNNFWVLKH